MMAPLPRIIALAAIVLVTIQVLFIFVADHHIKSSFSSVSSGSLFFEQEEDNDRPSPRKKIYTTIISNYTPDYTKFNTSLPPILYASSPESLPSLPEANRVPRHVLATKNFEEYYSNWTNGVSPHTLFVYNPSIIPLSLIAKKSSTKNGLENIQYLSSFRISSIHSCGFSTYEFWKFPVDYVGLALMNDDLTISTIIENDSRAYNAADNDDTTNIKESLDIIVDLNKHLPNIYGGRIKFQDVRLFILYDRLFMSSGLFLVPICVSIGDGLINPPDTRREYWVTLLSSPALCKQNDKATMVEVPALYRENDRLHLYVTGDAIRIRLKDASESGKNFQFFHLRSNHTSQQHNVSRVEKERVLMEYYPYSPREVHDLGNEIAKQYSTGGPTKKKKKIINLKRVGEFNSAVAPDPISKVSKSLDSSLRTFIKRDRASACCVKIEQKYYRNMIHSLDPSIASQLKNIDSILIGISHSKSRQRMSSSQGDRYNYLSRMYAFLPNEPFTLFARSGLFCFGFTGDNIDARGRRGDDVGNDYNKLTKRKKLELNKVTYNCPNIHFVNSIIEKNVDIDILIVSYGVNDCVPRFVEISKQHFVTHLFYSANADKT